MDRLACIDVVAFLLQLLLQDQPAWASLPVALIEDNKPQAPVLLVNRRARQLGVRPGQRYATALAIARDLRAGSIAPSRINQSIRTLADRLRVYSPHVEPSTEIPGVFWLDARGLNRLYPSLEMWAQAVRLDLQRAGVRATVAVGFTRFGAYALAKCHQGTMVCASVAEEHAGVQRMPLSSADLDPEVRERLRVLGIETMGDFLRLPGDGIRTRFGAATDALYQLAAGHRWAPLVPAPAEEPRERQIHFDTPESNTERLIFVVKRLLDSLLADLIRQAHAIVELTLWMKLDDRTTRTERIRPAATTIDVAQLLTLVRLRLDALSLSAGIVSLRITAAARPATSEQRRLFPQYAHRDPDLANQALARVRAELGEQSVVRACICDAHLPAAQFTWAPLERVPLRSLPRVVPMRSLVRRIYAHAVPLASGLRPWAESQRLEPRAQSPKPRAQSPAPRAQSLKPQAQGLDPLFGPYTVSGGWWGSGRGGVHRDYYYAQCGSENVWWVYYDHSQQRFFLQGCVE